MAPSPPSPRPASPSPSASPSSAPAWWACPPRGTSRSARRGHRARPRRCRRGVLLGNAGWLTPGIATPLPEPAVLKYGLRAVLSPSSPVYVPPSANPSFLKFVTGFTLPQHDEGVEEGHGRPRPGQRPVAGRLRHPQGGRRPGGHPRGPLLPRGVPHRAGAGDAARGDRAHPLRRPGHRLRRAQRRRGPHRRAVAVRRDRGRDPLHGQRFIVPAPTCTRSPTPSASAAARS